MRGLDAPVPGQSLTESPGNRPYERPPEITDVEEAIQMHLTRLSEPDKIEGIVDALELGLDIKSLTTGYLRSAVANGIHTPDVSMLVAPIVHEFIKKTAIEAGIEYDEGFVDEEAEERRRREVRYAKAARQLKKKSGDKSAPIPEADIPMASEELSEPVGGANEEPALVKRRMK